MDTCRRSEVELEVDERERVLASLLAPRRGCRPRPDGMYSFGTTPWLISFDEVDVVRVRLIFGSSSSSISAIFSSISSGVSGVYLHVDDGELAATAGLLGELVLEVDRAGPGDCR